MMDSVKIITIAIDILKQLKKVIPNAIDKWRFGKFFGSHVLSGENIFAVLDPYKHLLPRTGQPRYIKTFLNRKPDTPIIGEDLVLGVNIVRVIAYISSAFSQYCQITNSFRIVTDQEVENKWNGTFFCFGSSDSNIKTHDIEKMQSFYNFELMDNGFRGFIIGNRKYFIKSNQDDGIILKLRNPYSREHFLFVCAGIGEYGTSGSAYYLFNKWKRIYIKHKENEFCKIIEVKIGSDESAREVFSVPE